MIGKSLIFSLILFLTFSSMQSCTENISKVDIICSELEYKNYTTIGPEFQSVLECNVFNISVNVTVPDSEISSISTNNGQVSNASQITSLYIYNSRINFMPKGFKNKLPNLRNVYIVNSQLLNLKREDMEQFGNNLEMFAVPRNHLTSIDADLFDFNTNLVDINFSNNPLRYIDPRFFENIKNLQNLNFVYMTSAGCMDQFAAGDHNTVVNYEWNFGKCSNEVAKVESVLREMNGRVIQSLDNNSCFEKIIENATNQITGQYEKIGDDINDRIEDLLKQMIENNKHNSGFERYIETSVICGVMILSMGFSTMITLKRIKVEGKTFKNDIQADENKSSSVKFALSQIKEMQENLEKLMKSPMARPGRCENCARRRRSRSRSHDDDRTDEILNRIMELLSESRC